MSEPRPQPEHNEPDTASQQPDGLLRRHPKLAILLIAGVFYAILIGMALFILVLVFRG